LSHPAANRPTFTPGLPAVLIACVLGLTAGSAGAEECHLTIQSNDLMQYDTQRLAVPAQCSEVELTLHHSGTLSAKLMGHDWVLARSSDVAALLTAGLAAGASRGFLPANDPRVLASTGMIGGGATISVRFSTAVLRPGGDYTFFCSSPGHATAMKGKFVFGEPTRVASDRRL
jgi:azurin